MKFPFLDMLLDLFLAPYFQDIELCCVNLDENSPFGMYKPAAQEGLSELPCAQWYKDTYQNESVIILVTLTLFQRNGITTG